AAGKLVTRAFRSAGEGERCTPPKEAAQECAGSLSMKRWWQPSMSVYPPRMKATDFRITLIATLIASGAAFSKDAPALQEAVKNKISQEKENLLSLYRELHAAP